MSAAALSISLLILAAPPAGSIGEVGRIVNPSVQSRPSAQAEPGDVGRIDNPSYKHGDGRIVLRGAFDTGGDLNGDRWPDGWRRRVGQGYPSHVAMSLADDPAAPGGHCLRVELNGGAAAAYSPAVHVSPEYTYTVTAAVKTTGLQHDRAYITWRLLDADQKPIAEHASAKVGGDTPWRELTLPRQVSDDPRVRFAEVGVYVQPGDRADLAGSVSLADVRVVREPRLRVTAKRPWNIFDDGQSVTIECQVSGLAATPGGRSARLTMELIDLGSPIADAPRHRNESAIIHVSDLTVDAAAAPSKQYVVAWSPRLPGPGCYRLRTRLEAQSPVGRISNPSASETSDRRSEHSHSERSEESRRRAEIPRFAQDDRGSAQDDKASLLAEHETMLAVLPPAGRVAHGNFGWSLPGPDGSPLPPQLAELADRLGVRAVKLPLWLDEKDDARREAVRRVIEGLKSRDVRVIGVLANPSAQVRKTLFDDPAADGSVANLLTAPLAKLRPQIETAILPWALQVHDWQLGEDTDRSLRGSPQVAEKFRELTSELANEGLVVRWALPKTLVSEPPVRDKPPARDELPASGGLTPDEAPARAAPPSSPSPPRGEGRGEGSGAIDAIFLPSSRSPADIADHLSTNRPTAQQTWLTIEPPPANGTSSDGRLADFVHRLVAAAASGSDAVFVHDPLDPSHGMFQGDGSPGELLVPWLTTARQFSGAEYLGRLRLPGGSENRVFQRDAQVSIVLWSQKPTTEPLFIGPQSQQLDVWGRTTTPELRGSEQLIRVGPTPTFVIGGDAAIVRTQLGVQVQPPRLPSVASAPHTITLRVPNCFGRRVTGQVTLHLPDRWRVVSAKTAPLDLPAGGEATLPFRVRMPFDGASGPQPLRLEFEIAADKAVRFTVYREIEVGLGDVELTGSARLDEQGNLLVRQQLTNRGTADVSFACQLLIPGRRPQHVTVRRLPPGVHEHVYTVPDGRELLGKTLRLRADELGGQRVLGQPLVPQAAPSR